MLRGVDFLIKDLLLPWRLKTLENATHAKVNFDHESLHILVNIIDNNMGHYKSIRHAVVHPDPVNFAYAIMVAQRMKNDYYTLKVFSSVDAAKHWLDENN